MNITLYNILLAPHTTEKTVTAADKNKQFTFKVAKTANRTQVKRAVEKLFNVAVESVNISNVKSKQKRFRQKVGKSSAWKKALVFLKEGHDINLAEFE